MALGIIAAALYCEEMLQNDTLIEDYMTKSQ